MPVILVRQTVDHRVKGVVNLTAVQQIKCLHVQLVANALLIRTSRGDQEEQRLLTGITRAFGKDIVELAVWLGVYLIQDEAGHIQTVLRTNFSRQDLVESRVAIVHNTFGGCHDLAPLQQCRSHLHHLMSNIKNDGCLLTVCRSTIHFSRRFVIGKQQIQSHRCGKLGFTVLLTDFDIRRAELTVAALIHDTKHIPDDLLLPRQKPEPLPRPLAFGMAQVLDKSHSPVCLGFIVVAGREHEPAGFVIFQFRIVFRSCFCHQLPPPSRFSISSVASAGPPSEAMIRLREDGVRPNCSANLFIIFR